MVLSTLPPSVPPVQPAEVRPAADWAWLIPPANGVGYLAVNGNAYHVTEQQFEYESGQGGRLWRVRKPDGTEYQLTLNADGDLQCDCPDATYRCRACKHVHAIRAAYAELDRREALDRFLSASQPAPADAPF
jgi:hypothetical protein